MTLSEDLGTNLCSSKAMHSNSIAYKEQMVQKCKLLNLKEFGGVKD